MTHLELVPVPPVAQLAGVSQHYGKTVALNNITPVSYTHLSRSAGVRWIRARFLVPLQ